MNSRLLWVVSVALVAGASASPAFAQARSGGQGTPDATKKSITATRPAGASSTGISASQKDDSGMRQLSPEEVEKLKATQESKEPNPADPANQERPKALELSATSHDWGTISDDAVVNHTFQAKNTSSKTVKITVAASCGCTVSKLDKDTIEPGEEVPLAASFNPQGRSGQQTKTLTVTVVEPAGEFAQQFITITSNVRPLMMVEPARTFVQEVDHRQGKQERFSVISRKAGFEVQSVESNSEFVKATIGEKKTSEENGETVTTTEVLLDIGRGAPIGTLNSQLTVKSNDATGKPLTTFVGAEIIGDIRANPASTMIRATAPGSLISADIRLDTRSGKPFHVTSIDLETRQDMKLATDLRLASEDGTAYTIAISGLAPVTAGLIQGTILVATDSEGGESIRIPFTATVPRAPQAAQPAKVSSATPETRQSNPAVIQKPGTPEAKSVTLTPAAPDGRKQ